MFNSFLSFLFLLSGDYDLSLKYSDYLNESEKNYVKMICLHQLKDKNSIKYAELVIDDFSNIKRYKIIAELISEDIKKWKDNDLTDIGRDMNISKNRLNSGYTDKKTIEVQETIIKKLDEMIKREENPPKISMSNNKENSDSKNNQPNYQKESEIGTDSGKGEVDEKILNKIANWGKLPDKERKDIMHKLQLDFPPKFKSQIDAYNKAIRSAR